MDISFLLNKPELDPPPPLAPVGQPTATEYAYASQLQGDVHDDVGTPIPQLPLSPVFDTYEELFDFLRHFHINNGAAIVKSSSGTKRDIDVILQPNMDQVHVRPLPTTRVTMCRSSQAVNTEDSLPCRHHGISYKII